MLCLLSNLLRRLTDAGHSQFYCGAQPVCECKTPQSRASPHAFFHFLGVQTLTPALRICFRQIDEWTIGNFEAVQLLIQAASGWH
jgi:hypothetical protein